MEPIIRAGETYPLPSDMSKADALAYWNARDAEPFVVEDGQEIVGTYHLRPNTSGGGAHVANIGYMTSSTAVGKGVGRRMVEHSLQRARERGLQSCPVQLRRQYERTRNPSLQRLRLQHHRNAPS